MLPSLPALSFLSKIHAQEEQRSQYSSLSNAAQRNEALAENIESHCSLLTSESPSGFQTLCPSLYTLLTIWKILKGL